MKITKDKDPVLRALIKEYILYSATSRNYVIYKQFTDITDDIIQGALYNTQNELQEIEKEDYRQITQILIYEKIIMKHQYKTIDNLVSFIFTISKNRLLDFLGNYSVKRKTSRIAEKAQHMFNHGDLQFKDYIFTFTDEEKD